MDLKVSSLAQHADKINGLLARYGVRFGIYGHRFGAMARRGNIY